MKRGKSHMRNSEEIKIVNKRSLIIIWAAILLLAVIGLASQYPPAAVASLGAGVVCSLVYFLPIPDFPKIVGILLVPSFLTLIYMGMVGGSAVAFVANYVILAVAASYFNRKIIRAYAVIFLVIALACYLANPLTVTYSDNPAFTGAANIILFAAAASALYYAVRQGEKTLEKNQQILVQTEEDNRTATNIAGNLHTAILKGSEAVSRQEKESKIVQGSVATMLSTSDEMVSNVMSVKASMDEAGNSLKQNYELAEKLEKGFQVMAENVSRGNEGARTARESMLYLTDSVTAARNATDELLSEMNRITGILGEINNIARQTNLLSLNASIEAARAGEHGRGFAVVADEIRALSEESTTAANNIREILDWLVNTTNDVSGKIIEGTEAAKNSVAEVDNLSQMLDVIHSTTTDANQLILAEYDAIRDVGKNFTYIQKEMEMLVEASKENTAILDGISDSIMQQGLAMLSVNKEMEIIDGLSGELAKHFTQ